MFTAESMLSPTEHDFYYNGLRKKTVFGLQGIFQLQYREWPLGSILTPGRYVIHSHPDAAARTCT